MTSGEGRGGGAGAQDKVRPPTATGIASASVGAGISGSLPHIESPSISSGGLSGIDGSCGRGCACRIDGARGTAGLSVCAGKACSEVPAPVDALAGGVGAATAASPLSGGAAIAVSAFSGGAATAALAGGSTAKEFFQPGNLPCLGGGLSPYLLAGQSALQGW